MTSCNYIPHKLAKEFIIFFSSVILISSNSYDDSKNKILLFSFQTDENECKYRPCDVFAHCTNTLGSFMCTCFPGYHGDGLHCEGE